MRVCDFTRSEYHPILPFCFFTLKESGKTLRNRSLRQKGLVKIPQTLGQAIRNRRLKLGITQKDVAEQLNTQREVYDRWERDQCEPVVSKWPELIAFLGHYPGECEPPAKLTRMTRRLTGLDQKQLAQRIGVIHQKLRAWELEREMPDEDQLRRLKQVAQDAAKAFRLSTFDPRPSFSQSPENGSVA